MKNKKYIWIIFIIIVLAIVIIIVTGNKIKENTNEIESNTSIMSETKSNGFEVDNFGIKEFTSSNSNLKVKMEKGKDDEKHIILVSLVSKDSENEICYNISIEESLYDYDFEKNMLSNNGTASIYERNIGGVNIIEGEPLIDKTSEFCVHTEKHDYVFEKNNLPFRARSIIYTDSIASDIDNEEFLNNIFANIYIK